MARLLESVCGHETMIANLLAAKERFPHACVFSGPAGLGKKQVALGLIQALVCPEGGCGRCGSCVRIEKKQSESLLMVEPENNQIKVEAIRQVIQFFSLRGEQRFVVINEAQCLNPQASNALLKTLEEPPENSCLILITDSFDSLLPTIRSRAQNFRFGRLSESEMKKLYPQHPERTLGFAQGVPGRVEVFLDDGWAEHRSESLRFFQMACDGQRVSNDLFSDAEKMLRSIDFFRQFLRDWWLLQNHHQRRLRNADLAAQLEQLPLTEPRFRNLSLKLDEMERMMAFHVDRQLLSEDLFLSISGSEH